MEKAMKRDELRQKLLKATQRVVFVKKDGTKRTMICTLRKDVRDSYLGRSATARKEPANLLTVWDCDAQDWRRVNLDTLISVEDFAQVME